MWAKSSLSDTHSPTRDIESHTTILKSGWFAVRRRRLGSWHRVWVVLTRSALYLFRCPRGEIIDATQVQLLFQPILLGHFEHLDDGQSSASASASASLYPDMNSNSQPNNGSPNASELSSSARSGAAFGSFFGFGCKSESYGLLVACTCQRVWLRLSRAHLPGDPEKVWEEWAQAIKSTQKLRFLHTHGPIDAELMHVLGSAQFVNIAALKQSAQEQIADSNPGGTQLAQVVPRRCVVEASAALRNYARLDFNVFRFAEVTDSRPAQAFGYYCIKSLGLAHAFQISDSTLRGWLAETENGYLTSNLFHNKSHAADVTQTLFVMLVKTGMLRFFEPLEVLCALTSALTHDIQHPGVTNAFLKASDHPLAARFSPPVLERFHIETSFKVLSKSHCNLFAHLTKEQRQKAMHWMEELILATDMARHFDSRWEMNTVIDSDEGVDMNDPEGRLMVAKYMLHCADISNPSKPWGVYSQWIKRIMGEFYDQGDMESAKGLRVSMFMDRSQRSPTYEAKCQVGFIDTFVQPLFLTLLRLIRRYSPNSLSVMEEMLTNIETNKRLLKAVLHKVSVTSESAVTSPQKPPTALEDA